MKRNWLRGSIAALVGIACYLEEARSVAETPASLVALPGTSYASDSPSDACTCECVACDPLCCDCSQPWTLFPETCDGWQLYGWLNGGFTANAQEPASRFNGPNTFNDREDAMFNQAYFVMERRAQNGGEGWAWGARADVLWGTDYVFTQTIGQELQSDLSNHWNHRRFYGLALPQWYTETLYNDWSVKVGHFYSPLGYETVQATNNFFYSHSYTHRFAQPFTHVGALATHRWNDQFSFLVGIVNGADRLNGQVDRPAYLGGFTLNDACDQWSVTAVGFSSDEPNATPGAVSQLNMYSVVATYNIDRCTQFALEHDLANQQNFAAGASAQWYSIASYVYHTLNDQWKAGLRAEWFRDDDGVRVRGLRAGNPAIGGYQGNFYSFTAGLNYSPRPNLMFRPEVRYDIFEGVGLPFDDAARTRQFTAAFDMILRW